MHSPRAVSLLFTALLTVNAPVFAQEAGKGSGEYLSSRFARASGDRENAVKYLEAARAENPGDNRVAGQLLVLYLSSGNFQGAVEKARFLEKTGDYEKIVDLVLAVEAAATANYDEATRHFSKAYGDKNTVVWLPLLNSWMQLGEGKLKKPLDAAKGQKVPGFLLYQVALLNDLAGFTPVAEKQYQLTLADYRKAPFRAVEAAADFYRRAGKAAQLDKIKRDYLSAHPTMSALVVDSEAPSQLNALLVQGHGEGRMVSSVPEGVAEVMFTMASVIYAVDSAQDAELYLRLALRLRPDFPIAQLLLGNILESDERNADALAVYDAINPQSPLFSRALLRKAAVIESQGKLEEAVAMLDARISAFPDDVETYIAKGDLLRSRAKFAQAAEAYTQALEKVGDIKPQHWGLFFARAACYDRAGNWEKAEADLKRSLELNPDQPEVLNYLGYSLLEKGDSPRAALEMVEKAHQLQPDSPHIIDSLGWAYYRNGDFENAVKYLEQAIELMPGDVTVNDHLGDAYWQAGRKTEARYQWERALTFKPEAAQETAISQKLRNGLGALPGQPESALKITPAPQAVQAN